MKKSFIKELLQRRVFQIIGSYLFASTTAIFFIDWIINRYALPDYYVSLCLFGLVAIIPTVFIIAYFHGAPGKDEWSIVERTIIPLNILFIILILLAGYKYEWWLYGFETKTNNYIIHLSSNQKYTDYYYDDYITEDAFSIDPIEESLQDSMQNSIVVQLNENFFNQEVIIESSTSSKMKGLFNQLPHIKEIWDTDKYPERLELVIKKLKKEIYDTYNFLFENEIIIFIYKYYDKTKSDSKPEYINAIYYMSDFHYTGSLIIVKGGFNSINELIQKIVTKISGEIYGTHYGDSKVGIVDDIIEKNIVKIYFNKKMSLKKGMTLVSPAKYKFAKDGVKKRIEDYELAMQYIDNNPMYLSTNDESGFKLTIEDKKSFYDRLKHDYTRFKEGFIPPDVTSIWNSINYGLEILDINYNDNQEWGTAIAKIRWRYPEWVKVRQGDKLYIKGAFDITDFGQKKSVYGQ